MLAALSVGATGAVAALGNILPDRCCRLYKLFQQGKLAEAKELQLELLEINRTVTAGLGVPALKAAMDMLGYQGGCLRKPLQPLSEEQTAQLTEVLRRFL
jgi:4-hydroxy-2-oxoglutarate aldolase